MKAELVAAGKLGTQEKERRGNRKRHLDGKEQGRKERATRRRMEFDFDIWEKVLDINALIPSLQSLLTPPSRPHISPL